MSHRLPTPRGARAKPRGLAVLLIALAAILFIVVAPGVASTAPPGPDAPGADWAGDAHSDSDSDSDPDDTDEVDDTDTDTPAGSATDDPETTEPETTDPETTDESSAPSHPTGCGCGSSPMPGTSDTTSETTTTTSTGDPDPSTSGRETTSGRDGDGDDPSRGIRREEDAPSASDGDVSESDLAGVPANTGPAVTDVPTVAPPGGGGSTGPTPDSGSGSGPDTDRRSPQPDTGVEFDGSDTSQTVAGAAGPPVDPPQASPGVPEDSTLTSVRKFVLGVAPGALLLLGAVALLGSGSFLDSLRSMRP
ncbi:hypothetical protein [Gordonia hongkongensis]|uniref:Uncharacterized protein n=1 Tax=Gordonia hongkongensis TaxID=1701090 RepID=A0ABT6C045_9ACTN|nr:hypothetical protein [Gordonia hongkongensis]MDF6102714.1 hypothetical protein [Gordonia hongkongensis]